MEICYYPGCTLKTQAKELDVTARKAAELLGVTMTEIENWRDRKSTRLNSSHSRIAEAVVWV